MRFRKNRGSIGSLDGPTGSASSDSGQSNHTFVNVSQISDPFQRHLRKFSMVDQIRNLGSLTSTLPSNSKTSSNDTRLNGTESENTLAGPPEDALALLTFSRSAALVTRNDPKNTDQSSSNQSKRFVNDHSGEHSEIDISQVSEQSNINKKSLTNEPSVEFRYPIDFAAGVILRQKIILPILQVNESIKNASGDQNEYPRWRETIEATEKEIGVRLGCFMRGHKILINLGNKSNEGTKRLLDANGENITYGNNQRKRPIEQSEDNSRKEHKKSRKDSNVDSGQNQKAEGDKLTFPGSIERCTAEDASILSEWYHHLGDKYLLHTSPSWSNWWEDKCRIPEPVCEMLKLVLPTSEQIENETIAGVVYFERNVPDYMRNGKRTTLIRGIRIHPQYNPEVINRSQLIPSTTVNASANSTEICKFLFTAVLFNSLLCGTSCVGVSSTKSESEEQFYRNVMGEAIAFREEDGRKYFIMGGENRFMFLREQFENQLSLQAAQQNKVDANRNDTNNKVSRRISHVAEEKDLSLNSKSKNIECGDQIDAKNGAKSSGS